jgi:hypothetical protein
MRGPHPQCRCGLFAQRMQPTALLGRPRPMRHCVRRASAHRSGHRSPGARRVTVGGGATVAEVEQGEALKHPRRRGHPPGKWVEAAAHRSFLPTGRVEKSGRRGCPPTRWGLWLLAGSSVGVGRKRKLRRKYTRRKRRQGGAQGSAHRGGVRGGGGDRTTAVACSDRGTTLGQRCGQLRTW